MREEVTGGIEQQGVVAGSRKCKYRSQGNALERKGEHWSATRSTKVLLCYMKGHINVMRGTGLSGMRGTTSQFISMQNVSV